VNHDPALHESAHAAVATELGYSVHNIELHDDGGGICRLAPDTKLPPMDAAVIGFAGLEAGKVRLERAGASGYMAELDGRRWRPRTRTPRTGG
jgi:hypothetical protein